MLKRFIAFLLLIATLCSMLVFPVNAAAPTIKPSSEKYPTTLTKGSSFGIRGVYTTSAGKITSVSASLTYPNGSTNYGLFSASPNTTSFDVNGTKGSNKKTLNSTLSFGSLSTGSHTLRITIVAQSGTEKTTYTVSKSFTVVSSSTTATITASSENYPTTLTQGSSFGIRGVYKASSGTITKVQATVKNSAGTTKFSFTATPNTQSFDVNATKGTMDKTLNGTIAFGSLAAGSYTLEIKIYANGASSPTKTVTKSFAIVSSSTTATITASSENYPTTLTQGSSFGLRGVYKASSGTITKVQATVKNSAGTTKYSFTATPNTQSFDVNATKGTTGITLNSTVGFGSLAAGSYTLEIKLYANGASSPTKTVTKPFTIVSSTGSSSGGSSSGSSDTAYKNFYYTNSSGESCYNRYIFPKDASVYFPESFFQKTGEHKYLATKLGDISYYVLTVEDHSGTPEHPNNNPNNHYLKTYYIAWTNHVKALDINGDNTEAGNHAEIDILCCSDNISLRPNSNYPMISVKVGQQNPDLYSSTQCEFVTNTRISPSWSPVCKLLFDTAYGIVKGAISDKLELIETGVKWGDALFEITKTATGNIYTVKPKETFAHTYGEAAKPKIRSASAAMDSKTFLDSPECFVRLNFNEVHPKDAPAEYNRDAERVGYARFVYDIVCAEKTVYSIYKEYAFYYNFEAD